MTLPPHPPRLLSLVFARQSESIKKQVTTDESSAQKFLVHSHLTQSKIQSSHHSIRSSTQSCLLFLALTHYPNSPFLSLNSSPLSSLFLHLHLKYTPTLRSSTFFSDILPSHDFLSSFLRSQLKCHFIKENIPHHPTKSVSTHCSFSNTPA